MRLARAAQHRITLPISAVLRYQLQSTGQPTPPSPLPLTQSANHTLTTKLCKTLCKLETVTLFLFPLSFHSFPLLAPTHTLNFHSTPFSRLFVLVYPLFWLPLSFRLSILSSFLSLSLFLSFLFCSSAPPVCVEWCPAVQLKSTLLCGSFPRLSPFSLFLSFSLSFLKLPSLIVSCLIVSFHIFLVC